MRFRTARMSASLTQSMAATALGVGRSTVAMWEAGRAVPRTDKLQAMARLYRCTVDDLLQQDLRDSGARVAIGANPGCRGEQEPQAPTSPVVSAGNELRCEAATDVAQKPVTRAGERP